MFLGIRLLTWLDDPRGSNMTSYWTGCPFFELETGFVLYFDCKRVDGKSEMSTVEGNVAATDGEKLGREISFNNIKYRYRYVYS